jgi:hypothetical protein
MNMVERRALLERLRQCEPCLIALAWIAAMALFLGLAIRTTQMFLAKGP